MEINKINGFDLKFECLILKYKLKCEFMIFCDIKNL